MIDTDFEQRVDEYIGMHTLCMYSKPGMGKPFEEWLIARLLSTECIEWRPVMCAECGVRPAVYELGEGTRHFDSCPFVCEGCYCTCCYAVPLAEIREIEALWKLSGREELPPLPEDIKLVRVSR